MSVIFLTTVKYLRGIFRNRGRIGILILAPIIFFSFFGFIFSTSSDTVVRTIGIINHDEGYSDSLTDILPSSYPTSENSRSLSSIYLDLLENHTQILVNTDISITIRYYDNLDDLIADTETMSVNLGVVFNSQFTRSILSQINQQAGQDVFEVENANISLTTYGDTTTSVYQSSISLFQKTINNFVSDFVGVETLYEVPPEGGYLSFEKNTIQTDEFSFFSFFAAGFLIFLIILQSITVAGMLTEEKSDLTIIRLKLSNIRSSELFAGYTLGQVIAFSLQFFISVIVLQFWGINLSFIGWLNVFLISQLTNITIIGLSLIIATFVNSAEDAMTVTGIGSAPLGFLSGSFTPVPDVYLLPSINLQFWDFIPTYHASQAMIDIIFNSATFVDLIPYIATLVIYGLLIFIIGIYLFKRNVFDRDT